MEFKCDLCDFTTDNEDEIIYCDCGRTVCDKHFKSIEHQGWDDEMCDVCYKTYATRRKAMGDRI